MYLYDESGTPYGFVYNDSPYYYDKNLQGDVTGIWNKNGVKIANYVYDAWGNILSITNQYGEDVTSQPRHMGNLNPLRYRGYYYDAELEIYWLNTRFYDPNLGRFVNADGYASTGNGVLDKNMYAYCENNPVMCVDPTGEFGLFTVGIVAVCIVFGVTADNPKTIENHNNRKREEYRKVYNEDTINVRTPEEPKQPGKIDVVIDVDRINNDDELDPNIRIENSIQITDPQAQHVIVEVIMNSPEYDDEVFTRTEDSYVKEWSGHNIGYGLFQLLGDEERMGRTKHVDLNEKDSLRILWDLAG